MGVFRLVEVLAAPEGRRALRRVSASRDDPRGVGARATAEQGGGLVVRVKHRKGGRTGGDPLGRLLGGTQTPPSPFLQERSPGVAVTIQYVPSRLGVACSR